MRTDGRRDGRRDGQRDGQRDGGTKGHDHTIIRTVFKKRSYNNQWEHDNMVFVHRWSLIAASFMQKRSNWEFKNVVHIERELLFQSGLEQMF